MKAMSKMKDMMMMMLIARHWRHGGKGYNGMEVLRVCLYVCMVV